MRDIQIVIGLMFAVMLSVAPYTVSTQDVFWYSIELQAVTQFQV